MKKIFFFSLVTLFFLSLSAHEFWIQPEKFIYKKGEPVRINFMVGENFEGSNWTGDRSSVNSLKLYSSDFIDELNNSISDTKGDSLLLQYFDEGGLMLTYNSTNKFIELEPTKFNQYLQEDGLQNAIDFRKEHGEVDSAGREWYQRSVKTLIQVGDTKNDVYKTPSDLPLDIIPLSNPYKLKEGRELTVRLLFNNKPFANSLVKIWHRNNLETEKSELITNENGEVKFPVNLNGRWMVSAVKMERLEKDSSAQWQSYWGSLTWGYY